MRHVRLLVVVALLAAACGGSGSPSSVAADTPALSGPSDVGVVHIGGAEGLTTIGTLEGVVAGERRPGVLLLHMLGSNRLAWEPLVGTLVARGYVTLAIDLRGHGDTGGDTDWDLASVDVAAALDYLKAHDGVDSSRIAVIGASIGANLALVLGADQPEVRAVVALSPGLDYRGVKTEPTTGALAGRPVWLLASEGDGYSAETVRTLGTALPGAVVTVVPGNAHGTAMLVADPTLEGRIVEFLDTAVEHEPAGGRYGR